ncbi:MAG: heavy metal-associated domain-containing protein, partial [Candidatus Omnitrophota bacterium]
MVKSIRKTIIGIGGMHCASCAVNVEKQLASLRGVVEARVNFATGEASVSFDPGVVDIKKLFQAVSAAGYKPSGSEGAGPFGVQDAERQRLQRSLKIRFLISLCFG